MLSVRSGWAQAAVLSMTPREAFWLLKELDRVEDQRQIRMAEAWHSPGALKDRLEAKAPVPSKPAWDRLAMHLADTANLSPEKAKEIRDRQAALEFLEKKRRAR